MSLFLLVYDRKAGRLVSVERFGTGDQNAAEEARLALELKRDQNLEIVILEAESAAQLRTTHARYFGSEGMDALAESSVGAG